MILLGLRANCILFFISKTCSLLPYNIFCTSIFRGLQPVILSSV
ncbi:MAG: hypothetical protein [Malazfec virus 1]